MDGVQVQSRRLAGRDWDILRHLRHFRSERRNAHAQADMETTEYHNSIYNVLTVAEQLQQGFRTAVCTISGT